MALKCVFMFDGDQIGDWESATIIPAIGDTVYLSKTEYSVVQRAWSDFDFVSVRLASLASEGRVSRSDWDAQW